MSNEELYMWTEKLSSGYQLGEDFVKADVHSICETLQISEAAYYHWLKTKDKPTSRDILSVAIREVLKANKYNCNYGVRRMKAALDLKGIHVSINTTRDQMGIMGLLHHRRRPRGCTKTSKEEREAQDLVKQNFKAERPLEKALTDVTTIETAEGKLYVAAMLDCYSGEILALEMRDNMRKELCIALIEQVKTLFKDKVEGMIVHSDRGSQYTSQEYKNAVLKAGMCQSLCGDYHCYDNSRMESFFATLKKELIYQYPTYKMSQAEVRHMIFCYVFTYYNRERLTSENPGYLPPSIYREQQMGISSE